MIIYENFNEILMLNPLAKPSNARHGPETSASLSNASLIINGSLTISGAALQLQLHNASVAVSGDLRIQDGMILTVQFRHIAINLKDSVFSQSRAQ